MANLKEMQDTLNKYSRLVQTSNDRIKELRVLYEHETNTREIQRLKQQLLDEKKRLEGYVSARDDWTEQIYEEEWGHA